MKENLFIITKTDGSTKKYLRHEGHNHFWTLQRIEAMEYSKLEVAQALAKQQNGNVEAI